MDPAALELQVFVSLIVILGTAFVALVCDYLKGNNERLREHNIELRVRKEEREKGSPAEVVQWLQQLLNATQANTLSPVEPRKVLRREVAVPPPAARRPEPSVEPVARAAAPVSDPRPVEAPLPAVELPGQRSRTSQPDREAAEIPGSLLNSLPKPAWLQREQQEKAALRAARQQQVETPIPVPEAALQTESAPAAGSPAATKRGDGVWTYRGLLDRVVAATGDRKDGLVTAIFNPSPAPIASETETRELKAEPQPATPEAIIEQVIVSEQASDSALAPSAPTLFTVAVEAPTEPMQEAVEAAAHEETAMAAVSSAELANSTAVPDVVALAGSVTAMPVISPVSELQLPAGYFDRSVLSGLLSSTETITGVVVAIGINDYAHQAEKLGLKGMNEWVANVEGMIRSLLEPSKDFGCRSSEDEFVLVFPKETGVVAQRRLTIISERLWSFQLRSLGSMSVMFSWGAVEIQNETLADACASASERMYQTKRSRKTVSLDSGRNRKAVNL